MQKIPMIWSFFLSHTLLLFTMTSGAASDVVEVDDEREFDYLRGSEKGPEHWGDLKKEWATCKVGQMQSPIDLSHPRVEIITTSTKMKMFYKPDQAVHRNRGHDIMVEWKGNVNKIEINETEYILRQCHWHSPSEHTINGQRFAAELHMVHQSKDSKIAVITMLYRIGKPNAFLSKLVKKIKRIPDPTEEVDAGKLNPAMINVGGSEYYRYIGSLTTPPCTEGVIWTISTQVATLSKHQVALLRDAVEDHAEQNARPVQPLNGRKAQLYTSENR